MARTITWTSCAHGVTRSAAPDGNWPQRRQRRGLGGKADYAEALLPGHLQGDGEGEAEAEAEAGRNAGDVLDGDAPIAAALAELKKMGAGGAAPKH